MGCSRRVKNPAANFNHLWHPESILQWVDRWDICVNCVFVFSLDGQICTLNCPGSWHNSTVSEYGIYQKMEHSLYHLHGVNTCVDSAFKMGDRDFLIKSLQQDPLDNRGVQLNWVATSVCQLSEHAGMQMIQDQFPRLKDPVQFETFGERKVILHLMVLLYNYYQTGQV